MRYKKNLERQPTWQEKLLWLRLFGREQIKIRAAGANSVIRINVLLQSPTRSAIGVSIYVLEPPKIGTMFGVIFRLRR